MQSENRTLRQQLYGMSQEALDTSSEVERLSAEVASLQVKVKEGEETIKRLLGAAAESVGRPVQYWAGMTQTGAIMIFDPECQMSCGQHVLLFLPSISDYRVFGKGSMRSRLTKLAGDELAHHAAAYEEWLRTPTNRDIQKKAIAQLVKRASTSPKKP